MNMNMRPVLHKVKKRGLSLIQTLHKFVTVISSYFEEAFPDLCSTKLCAKTYVVVIAEGKRPEP